MKGVSRSGQSSSISGSVLFKSASSKPFPFRSNFRIDGRTDEGKVLDLILCFDWCFGETANFALIGVGRAETSIV